MTVSATRLVSTGTVEVSAGDRVDGNLVESTTGSSFVSLSLQAIRMPANARIAKNFFIVLNFLGLSKVKSSFRKDISPVSGLFFPEKDPYRNSCKVEVLS